MLLNIIGYNQTLVDDFRAKLKINTQGNFKEIETKYNIISSGLFHNQLCSNCIHNISTMESQFKYSDKEKDYMKNPEVSGQK